MARVNELLAAFGSSEREPSPGDLLKIRDRWRWCDQQGKDRDHLEGVLWEAVAAGYVALARRQPPRVIARIGPNIVLTAKGAARATQLVR